MLKINYAPLEPAEAFWYWPIGDQRRSGRWVLLREGLFLCLMIVGCLGAVLIDLAWHYALGVKRSEESLDVLLEALLAIAFALLRVVGAHMFLANYVSMEDSLPMHML